MEDKNCMNCRWAEEIEDFKIAKICTNKLSGNYNTDVTKYEYCHQFKLVESEGE